MSYTSAIPVLKLPLLKMDSYRAQCEKAYQGLPLCTSSGLSMSQNELNLENALGFFLSNTPTLFKIGLTHVDIVMRMYAICQVASYRLQVGVYKPDIIQNAIYALNWKNADLIDGFNMIYIMENFCANWVFRNESVYMKKYLNNAGFV